MNLVNVEEMARKYRGYFFIPTLKRRQSVVVGEYVKVCRNSERFWLRVTQVKNGSYTGVVSNELLLNPDLREGEALQFGPEHIYDIITEKMLNCGGPSVIEEAMNR